MANKFDLKIQIHERLINRLVMAAYYVGQFSVPQPIRGPFSSIVEISLPSVPVIHLNPNELEVALLPRITIKRTNMPDLVFNIRLIVGVNPTYNKSTHQLELEFIQGTLQFFYNRSNFSVTTNQTINTILSNVLTNYLFQQVVRIRVSWDLIGISGFVFELGGIKIEQDQLSVGINLKGYSGGNINRLQNFVGSNMAASALSEDGLNRFMVELWNKGMFPKQFQDSRRVKIKKDLIRPLIVDYTDLRLHWNVIQQIMLIDAQAHYSWKVTIEPVPSIDFGSSTHAVATMRFRFSYKASVRVVATFRVLRMKHFWKLIGKLFGKKHKARDYTYNINIWDYKFGPTRVKTKSTVSLKLDGNRIKPKIEKLNFTAKPVLSNFHDYVKLLKKLLNPTGVILESIGYTIINNFPGEIRDILNDKLPPISIPLFSSTIPGANQLQPAPRISKFHTTNEQVVVVVN